MRSRILPPCILSVIFGPKNYMSDITAGRWTTLNGILLIWRKMEKPSRGEGKTKEGCEVV